MPRNKEDFNAGYYGPAQRVKVTPSAADADATGTEAYSFEAGSKSVGKHIARAIKSGLPKPEKVEFNKE